MDSHTAETMGELLPKGFFPWRHNIISTDAIPDGRSRLSDC